MAEPEDPEALRRQAHALGFLRLGVARAGRSPHADRYLAWLAAGRHGQMSYLARQVARRTDPRVTLPEARSVIVASLPYERAPEFPPVGVPGHGKIARYARGRDYHRVLPPLLRALASTIEDHGRWRTWWTVDTGPLLERDWAESAGIGWIGKHGLVIDARHGSYFFLGVIVTDRCYRPDAPATDHCGSCRACVDACPTQAITPRSVDARRCISYLTIEHRGALPATLASRLHGWVFGCDICQEVCPYNQRRPAPDAPPIHPHLVPRPLPTTLADLAQFERADYLAAFAGTALTRTGWSGLRRNAQALMGVQSTGTPAAPREECS